MRRIIFLAGLLALCGASAHAGNVLVDANVHLGATSLYDPTGTPISPAIESGGNLAQLVTDSGPPGATACATDTASCNFNQLLQRLAQRLTTINATLNAPLQAGGTVVLGAGSAIVGNVRIDQTTDGTTNAVHLVAGTAIAGKFGIDQTTPGTTNAVAVDQSTDGTTNAVHLKAGTAIAGKFGIDQTTDGTTNAVHLVAGTALAGKFSIDQTTPGTTNAVVASAGTNLNTSLLALESGGNLDQHTTDFGAPGATACATDTGSCNFNQLLQRLAQRLTTINGTLGSPIQTTGGTVGLVAGSAIVGNFRIDQTTDGTTNGVHLVAGSNIVGNVRIDQTTDGTTNGVHLTAGSNLAGKFGIDQTTQGTTNGVVILPSTANGCTGFHLIAAASNNATNVKNSAGVLCQVVVLNYGAAAGQDLRFYNTSTTPTCSSATGVVWNFPIPTNPTVANEAGMVVPIPAGLNFTTGISYCITGAVADNDNTNAAATSIVLNGSYN